MVRNAKSDDLSRIAEIIVFSKRMAYRCFLNNDPLEFNKLQVVNEIQKINENNSLTDYFIFDDGIVKGLMKLSFVEDSLSIEKLFVDPFFQQNGIGTQLIEYAINFSKERNVHKINLFVYPQNECAIKFYENLGFVRNFEESQDINTKLKTIGYTLQI